MERFHPICDARSRVSRNITIRAERLARRPLDRLAGNQLRPTQI